MISFNKKGGGTKSRDPNAINKFGVPLVRVIYIYIYILEWTRALNARSKLATGEVAAAFVGPKRPFVSLWNRLG